MDLASHVREFGQIFDLYIARKRDSRGNRFGFLSLLDVKDKVELLRNLRNIRMGNNKLWFNVARFILEDGEVNRHKDDPVKNQSYLFGNGGNVFQGSKFEPGEMSFKNMLVGKSLKIDDNAIGFSGLHGCAIVGRMVDVEAMRSVYLFLHNVCPGSGNVQYLGGLDLLISFNNPDLANRVLEAAKKETVWFSSVCMWTGQALSYERLAWLKVTGVPLHLFNNGIFNSVGGLFGKVVSKASKLDSDVDLSFDYVGILAGDGSKISEEIVMEWKNRKFRVWINEELGDWTPDFYPVLMHTDQSKDNEAPVDVQAATGAHGVEETAESAMAEDTPELSPVHVAGDVEKGNAENVVLERIDDEIIVDINCQSNNNVDINCQSNNNVEEVFSEFIPAEKFDFENQGLEASHSDCNNKVVKRKKCKKSDLGRSSNNYTSSNESLRVVKKPKQKKSDMFGLNGLLGISDSESSSDEESIEEAQVSSIDLNSRPTEVQHSDCSTPFVAVAADQEKLEGDDEFTLKRKEIKATKSMGIKLGINLEHQDNLIMEAIVDEGVQKGNK